MCNSGVLVLIKESTRRMDTNAIFIFILASCYPYLFFLLFLVHCSFQLLIAIEGFRPSSMKETGFGFSDTTRPNALTLANYPGICDLLRAPCVRYGKRDSGSGWPGEIEIEKKRRQRKSRRRKKR